MESSEDGRGEGGGGRRRWLTRGLEGQIAFRNPTNTDDNND